MINAPALVLRGALLGCVVVCLLTAMISASPGSGQSAALAAVESPTTGMPETSLPANPQPAADQPPTAAAAAVKQSQARQPAKKNKAPKAECTLSTSYSQNILQWCSLIEKAARQYDLPANLLAALILQESGGQPQAYSTSGAVGLMQVMPRDGIAASFQCANGPCFAARPTIQELQDPAFNVDYGARYLASLVERRGSLREALYAYGPMGVGYYYADKVLAIYAAHGGN